MPAVEWVGFVSGLVLGLAGIITAYKSTNRQQDTALKVAQQQIDGQLTMAREERHERRLEESYKQLVATLASDWAWIIKVYPSNPSSPADFTMPPPPEPLDKAQAEAFTAYMSPRVRQLWDDWRKAWMSVYVAGDGIRQALADEVGDSDVALARERLGERMTSAWDAAERVREQVRLELFGQDDGSAVPTK